MLKKLKCKLLGHSWFTIRNNRYMVPMEQICRRCGLECCADVDLSQAEPRYFWKFSDGTESKKLNLHTIG